MKPKRLTTKNISGTATTVSLIILGGGLTFQGIGSYKKELAVATAGKLVLLPMLFLPLAVWMGFREMELLCLLILFDRCDNKGVPHHVPDDLPRVGALLAEHLQGHHGVGVKMWRA